MYWTMVKKCGDRKGYTEKNEQRTGLELNIYRRILFRLFTGAH
jgi:hypothetical protein